MLLRQLDRMLLSGTEGVTITCFFLLTILVTANVFVRFVPVVSLHWFDEIIELLYAYLVFYGAAALWITREHLVRRRLDQRAADSQGSRPPGALPDSSWSSWSCSLPPSFSTYPCG